MKAWIILAFILLSSLHSEQILEVALPTKKDLKPIYLSKLRGSSKELEQLYAILHFDLEQCGVFSLVPIHEEWDQQISDPAFLNREQILASLAVEGSRGQFLIKIVQASGGASKNQSVSLTGALDQDRRAIHQLSDSIQMELTGKRGIASRRILFSERVKEATKSEWHSTIWVSDWDGANAKRLTSTKGYCMSPGFLPFGGYFFVSSEQGQSKIYRGSFADSKIEPWIILRGNQVLPALSPDGSRIAYITDVAGRPDLFVQEILSLGKTLGVPRQLYSAPGATQASPTFSPDGKTIAFVSDKEGSPKIYLMELAAKYPHPKLITKKNRENSSPCWSADGSKLAYSARNSGSRQIWIYEFATNQEWQLTSGEGNKENPFWAPDSLHLVYNTETEDSSELFLIDLNRQEPLQISSGPGQKRFASWEP